MIAWEESPRQFKMSKQLDEGKFGEDLARKFLNDPIIKVNHGISHYDDVTQDKSYQDKDTDFIVWKKNGKTFGLEAKVDSHNTGNFYLETSVDYFSMVPDALNEQRVARRYRDGIDPLWHTPGWVYRSGADQILYYFRTTQLLYIFSRVDIEKVLTYIRTNAKTFRQKLRKLYITQQKKQIDVKKTIEKSIQCDGEITRLYYKKPIKSKANVVMLADISGSCRAMTSLALTYMGLMREVFPGGCHLFVFVNHLVPVDRYFSNENVTAAVESINKNVPSRGIYSNYGVPLKELRYDNTGIINKDTTIVMLGDCRNNRNYSGVEDVEWLSKRASNFFVLNPEPRDEWGQGDSIADLYAKSGAVVSRVSSAKDLLNFLQSAGTTRHL